jgi:tetratricopeptide (TPR) repeat protein
VRRFCLAGDEGGIQDVGEAESAHAAWAATLQLRTFTGLDEVRRQGDLALHHEGAHDMEACLKASLGAADLAAKLKTPREEALHLRRAVYLWPQVRRDTDKSGQELDLLERVAYVTNLVGDGQASLAALNRALDLVDERAEPLRASRLLLRSASSTWAMGTVNAPSPAEAARAVELAKPCPQSEEYAVALAELGRLQAHENDHEPARKNADEAVRVAHLSGSVDALAMAYRSRGYAYLGQTCADGDTAEALRLARTSGDPETVWAALLARVNYLYRRGRIAEAVDLESEFLPFAMEAGALSNGVFVAGLLAYNLLELGRWSECASAVREGLSVSGLPSGSARVRLSAAALSLRQGCPDVAGMHLRRAEELLPALEDRAGMPAPDILAEYLLATGQAGAALGLLSRTMVAHSVEPRRIDAMLMWGARAAAELVELARDRHDRRAVKQALVRFEDFVAASTRFQRQPFEVIEADDLIQPAMKAIFIAESARCGPEGRTSNAWEEAASQCGTAGLRWEEAIASWRWAQALLHESATRATLAVPLRAAYRFAVEVGARPLQHEVESLAIISRIRLDEPATRTTDHLLPPFDTLSHLVAGRTYAEIARELFISEKTVSVHVSNLLRKTGASSSREVSALALRLG